MLSLPIEKWDNKRNVSFVLSSEEHQLLAVASLYFTGGEGGLFYICHTVLLCIHTLSYHLSMLVPAGACALHGIALKILGKSLSLKFLYQISYIRYV